MADRNRAVKVEICIDDLHGAIVTEAEGADGVEICSALSDGGLTPSFGLVRTILRRTRRIAVMVMIRARPGAFLASPDDLSVMLSDIAAFEALARDEGRPIGFVFGVLTPACGIDHHAVASLVAACGAAPKTFHKAFDLLPDFPDAVGTLAGLGFTRVLTSGGAPTTQAGAAMLARLVKEAPPSLAIMAGGGVRAANVGALIERTGVSAVHARAMRVVPGQPPSTSAEEVAALLRAAKAPS